MYCPKCGELTFTRIDSDIEPGERRDLFFCTHCQFLCVLDRGQEVREWFSEVQEANQNG